MGLIRQALETLAPKRFALTFAADAPVWVAAARPQDERADRPPDEWLTADECRQMAANFDPRQRRVFWVAEPEGFGSGHWSYYPVGEVVDVDFDGKSLWLATRSIIDPDSGKSRMDSLIAGGWTNQSILLDPKSPEVNGQAQLGHCALMAGGEQPAIMSLPSMDTYDFGGPVGAVEPAELARETPSRKRLFGPIAARLKMAAARGGATRKTVTPREIMSLSEKELEAIAGSVARALSKTLSTAAPTVATATEDPETKPETPATATPADTPATHAAPETLGRERAEVWAARLVEDERILPSARRRYASILARQTETEARETIRDLSRIRISQAEAIASERVADLPTLDLTAKGMPRVLDRSWGSGVTPESIELVACCLALLRQNGHNLAETKVSPSQLLAAGRQVSGNLAARRELAAYA